MQHYMKRRPSMQKERNKSNFRMVIIAVILGLIAYYLFFM